MRVQVRGWGGSGKSTLMRQLIGEHLVEKVNQLHRPDFVRVSTRTGKRYPVKPDVWRLVGDLYVLGNYDLVKQTTGGADYVSGDVGIEIMRWYAPKCVHLVWEGRNASTRQAKGAWLDVLREFGIVWATLDTPAEVGKKNILEGRAGKISDEKMFADNYRYVENYIQGAMDAGIRCETLNYARAYEQLHALLEEGGWICTSPDCTRPKST